MGGSWWVGWLVVQMKAERQNRLLFLTYDEQENAGGPAECAVDFRFEEFFACLKESETKRVFYEVLRRVVYIASQSVFDFLFNKKGKNTRYKIIFFLVRLK